MNENNHPQSQQTTIKEHHWPDDVRLTMIEKSEWYGEPKVYQYGFYDGYQHRWKETQGNFTVSKNGYRKEDEHRPIVETYRIIDTGKNTIVASNVSPQYVDIILAALNKI